MVDVLYSCANADALLSVKKNLHVKCHETPPCNHIVECYKHFLVPNKTEDLIDETNNHLKLDQLYSLCTAKSVSVQSGLY